MSLMLCGCDNSSKSLKELMAESEYIIVDVRTEEEYNDEHISGAINIPYDTIDENSSRNYKGCRLENSELDKEKTIFVYCRSGKRSNIAFNTLTSLGYRVYDLGAYEGIDLPKE